MYTNAEKHSGSGSSFTISYHVHRLVRKNPPHTDIGHVDGHVVYVQQQKHYFL